MERKERGEGRRSGWRTEASRSPIATDIDEAYRRFDARKPRESRAAERLDESAHAVADGKGRPDGASGS